MSTEYYQDTAARFQERCFQKALAMRFEVPRNGHNELGGHDDISVRR